MAFQRNNSDIQERFENILAYALVQVKTEEDPLVLNEFKKLFKKNVPLSLRSYVAAYMVKQIACGVSFNSVPRCLSAGSAKKSERRGAHAGRIAAKNGGTVREHGKASKKESALTRADIDPESAATIFISIGRSRGVFPRDLIGLISQSASIERERIGEIRVLDNYSFVQVYADDAEKVITSLNGSEYRNRKLTVSHSRKKENAENETVSAAENI